MYVKFTYTFTKDRQTVSIRNIFSSVSGLFINLYTTSKNLSFILVDSFYKGLLSSFVAIWFLSSAVTNPQLLNFPFLPQIFASFYWWSKCIYLGLCYGGVIFTLQVLDTLNSAQKTGSFLDTCETKSGDIKDILNDFFGNRFIKSEEPIVQFRCFVFDNSDLGDYKFCFLCLQFYKYHNQ